MTDLWNFLNSQFFVALVGSVGAITAYWIYKRNIRQHKKDAANILLLEIQNAKRQMAVVSKQFKDAADDETKMLAEDTFLMPNESWNKYKYLFVRNFDRDEWDNISTFYDKCYLFDKAVRHNNEAFPQNAEQLRNAMYESVRAVLSEYVDTNPTAKRYSEAENTAVLKAGKIHDLIQENAARLFSYAPRKPILDARAQLDELKALDLELVVLKFKKIARVKN